MIGKCQMLNNLGTREMKLKYIEGAKCSSFSTRLIALAENLNLVLKTTSKLQLRVHLLLLTSAGLCALRCTHTMRHAGNIMKNYNNKF